MADTLSELSKSAKTYWKNEEWGAYRNVRYESAEHVRREGDRQRAAYLYVEVMVFDLQGVSGVGDDGFSRAYRGETPSVAREIARFSLRAGHGEEELHDIFRQVASKFWVDAFPRSREEVWEEMYDIVTKYRETVQVKARAESLGSNELLSAEEATTYAEVADDYELLRRIGTLLEDEPPADIPWEKRKRAHEYLSTIDVDHLPDRWKAKAYRWAGEIVLSNDEKEAALTYFERAVEGADRVDRVAVERMAERLRRTLDQGESAA